MNEMIFAGVAFIQEHHGTGHRNHPIRVFVKNDLKGVLNYIGVRIFTQPRTVGSFRINRRKYSRLARKWFSFA
jgi:hypothetical protein